LKVRLLTVGRVKQEGLRLAAAEYGRRLAAYTQFELVEVRDAKLADWQAGLGREAQDLLAQVRPGDHLVLLDSGGTQFDSPGLARWLERHRERPFVFLIGSSYGVAPTVRERAESRWSLSALTLPHELARVVVLEQLYRAATILAGHPYHH